MGGSPRVRNLKHGRERRVSAAINCRSGRAIASRIRRTFAHARDAEDGARAVLSAATSQYYVASLPWPARADYGKRHVSLVRRSFRHRCLRVLIVTLGQRPIADHGNAGGRRCARYAVHAVAALVSWHVTRFACFLFAQLDVPTRARTHAGEFLRPSFSTAARRCSCARGPAPDRRFKRRGRGRGDGSGR